MNPPQWKRRAVGGWITTDGKWSIRGPIWGKRMYWLYGPADARGRAGRFSPTGRYADRVSFRSVIGAKRFVARIGG